MTFESAKLLAASTSTVEWYKSRAHISFLSEVIQILMWANSTLTRYSSRQDKYMYAFKNTHTHTHTHSLSTSILHCLNSTKSLFVAGMIQATPTHPHSLTSPQTHPLTHTCTCVLQTSSREPSIPLFFVHLISTSSSGTIMPTQAALRLSP